MKLLHTADLHIGKSLFEFSLLEEQKEILKQIANLACEEQVDAVLIAGDVYDRSVPSAEAVTVLSDFLTELSVSEIPVYMVAGNHDSAERLGFASTLLNKGGLFVAGKKGVQERFTDAYGNVNLYLLPFGHPQAEGVSTMGEAVRKRLSAWQVNTEERNVLLTHYFVTAQGETPELSDSEQDIYVGGLDSVDVSAFSDFDYVALGHIHRPQRIGRDTVYYAGSPLKYSFSECTHGKGVTLVELREKGQIQIEWRELTPVHDLCRIRGELEKLLRPECLSDQNRMNYVQVTLTDQRELLEPAARLRSVYPNLCQVLFERKDGTGSDSADGDTEGADGETHDSRLEKLRGCSVPELFRDFYEQVSEWDWSEEKEAVIRRMCEELEEKE